MQRGVFWTPQWQLKGSYEIGSVYIILSFCLSRGFLGIVLSVFSTFWHGARNSHEVLDNRARFSENNFFFAFKIGKMDQKWFFEFIGKFYHQFLLNFFYKRIMFYEKLFQLLCSCTNPMFEKILVPEIWALMFSANQITGFFNQPYLQKKSMKKLYFLHVDTKPHKLLLGQKKFQCAW